MTSLNLATLRERGEQFSEALARESYLAGAGLKEATDFAGLFARYPDLSSSEAVAAAQGRRALLEWAVDNRVGRATAALEDRLHAFEQAAVVRLPDGETIPFQRVAVLIANEPRRERRLALDLARRAVLEEPTAIKREKLGLERELLAPFGNGGGTVAARARLSGIALDGLGAACDAFLASTADLYRAVLDERVRRVLDLAPGEATRSDAAWLFREASYDDVFGAADLVPTARRQVGAMGLDVEAGGRIRFDTEDRERKRSRAFCAPVRVPHEVYLVIRPFGGYVDYRAFWHELGHALHFGNASALLPFEDRWLGDNSVTESYAMLFEHMLASRAWLAHYTALRGERLAAFTRDQAFNLLAIVRRYAAKLRYELAVHRLASFAGAPGLYVELLTAATGFRYHPQDALLDFDDAFYAARYLRAWQMEALLSDWLRERFDEDWFRNPRSGPALAALLERGQRDLADELTREVLGRPLAEGFTVLARRCESALA
ncbi:MAG: hypothetical protein A2085_08245 [Gemmatimonadetes bacterium GWC2_71_10]|nr:MAG: hypothetical protein A2085_08245 [Gemmatimonadetes bacterium GWC2_71_10]